MGNTLDWMLAKRLHLLTHIEEKKPIDAHIEVWYIEAAAVATATAVVNATLTKIQKKDMIISQQRNTLINFTEDQGSFIRDLLGNLSLGDKEKVLQDIGKFILYILEGMCDVHGECDSWNQAAASPPLAVMPAELIKMPPLYLLPRCSTHA
ncbi:hypothetical protein AXG93_2956s1030 [Marchantia polymorpha subsp. ruderalis]|uniref:Uncharacterized protein n=1 Tax=Marchantia polymorpha subsp. ruderalis TaxID=1480154 RepID=A0A176WC80_MARPO|nr:hypothetical protein AXG93_2956s1030 [Marchantia polymorpha subsp. ruderalis]